MTQRANGEGTVFHRSDGRWAACYFAHNAQGRRRRKYVYGRTRAEALRKLRAGLQREAEGRPVIPAAMTVGTYLTYWLDQVASVRCRPSTLADYRSIVERHIVPEIGSLPLERLSVASVQTMLSRRLAEGATPRGAQEIKKVLRAALSRAETEELVTRNVAKFIEVPRWETAEVVPWSTAEAHQFLGAAQTHRLFPAFLMQLAYGLRRGEVLGLVWGDVDFATNRIRVHQQLQRVDGSLQLVPTKTRSSNRILPLIPTVRSLLLGLTSSRDADATIFTTTTNMPIDPRNYGRVFQQLVAKAGVRRIKLHGLRHTTATMLKDHQVPVRDAQLVLGHADALTTLRLYQHGEATSQHDVLQRLTETLYMRAEAGLIPVAVRTAVILHKFLGQDSWKAVLTSGGPGGTRNLDTLLKRDLETADFDCFTSVVRTVRATAVRDRVAHVAVTSCCQRVTSGDRCKAIYRRRQAWVRSTNELFLDAA